jgi:hypothetical protein
MGHLPPPADTEPCLCQKAKKTQKFEVTSGPSSPVKKPKPRSPSPAMNTHPMMTRSKARAAAISLLYVKRQSERAERHAKKAKENRLAAEKDIYRITDIEMHFINKEILCMFLGNEAKDNKKLDAIDDDIYFEVEFYYTKGGNKTHNNIRWNCPQLDYYWRDVYYNTSSCFAAMMCNFCDD